MNTFKDLAKQLAYTPRIVSVGGGWAAMNMPRPDPVNNFFMSV